MKKIIPSLLLIFILSNVTKAQYVNIPDSLFRSYLLTNYPTCFNSAKQMDTTCSAIVNEDSLNMGMYVMSVVSSNAYTFDLDGVQYFKSLKYLNTHPPAGNFVAGRHIKMPPKFPDSLVTIDFSVCGIWSFVPFPNSLKNLYLNDCNIASLPILSANLESMFAAKNQLTNLPSILPTNLKILDCSNNKLASLPVMPNYLESLVCKSNTGIKNLPTLPTTITYLDVSQCSLNAIPYLPNLKYLDCSSNKLITSLPILPDFLTDLFCYRNKINNILKFPDSLINLNCNDNFLDSLPDFPTELNSIECANNNLTKLPVIPQKVWLINFSNNKISHIDSIPASVYEINCAWNLLSELPPLPVPPISLVCCYNPNLYCLPFLGSDSLQTSVLYIDTARIRCIPVSGNFLVFHNYIGLTSSSNYPICNPTNNVNHCIAFPSIQGNVFYDVNKNGIKDANELYKSNCKIKLSNGSINFTQQNGNYQFTMNSIGSYSITATQNFFKSVPDSIKFDFHNYDTFVVVNDIALQPLIIKDSFSLYVHPMVSIARPNRSYPFYFAYENNGTTALNPTIIFKYDSSILHFDSSSNPLVTNNGINLSLSVNNFVPGQSNHLIAYFHIKSTATIGTPITTVTVMSANTVSITDTLRTLANSSYDPNEKLATAALTPIQVQQDKFVDYTIYFQNTGNDTAFNIVIADTLDNKLDASSLEMVASSGNCKTTLKDGIIYFEFLDINLVDSNHNEPKSHGFINYKIRPKKNVVIGDTIFNIANIYFDYNKAVATNTAQTLINLTGVITPLKLLSFSAKLQPNPNSSKEGNVLLEWQTANEVNVSHINIQRSNNGKDFGNIGKVNASSVSGYSFLDNKLPDTNELYYRLEIVDKDGSKTYSEIKSVDRKPSTVSGIAIYPNPAKDLVTIGCIGAKELLIVDYLGRTAKQFTNPSNSIFWRVGQAGIYIVKAIMNNGEIKTEKLVVE